MRVATVHGFKSNNRVFRHFDAVICVSSAIRDRVGLPQSCFIPNGISQGQIVARDKQYYQRNFNLRSGRPVAVSIGRLAPVKGYAQLLQAWQGIDAHLVIAGEGPERATLKSLIDKLQLNNRVHLVGFRRDVPQLLANSDLVVIASEREGFPYSMVESLHLEKVIVSTRFPGASDYLPEKYLVPYGQTEAFRETIRCTLADRDQADRDYQTAWQWAQSSLTIEGMVADTEQIYYKTHQVAA